jgi:hypothetical protein
MALAWRRSNSFRQTTWLNEAMRSHLSIQAANVEEIRGPSPVCCRPGASPLLGSEAVEKPVTTGAFECRLAATAARLVR